MVREELGAVGCLSFKHKFDKIRFINNNIKIKLYFEINKDRYSFQENIKIKCGYLFIFNNVIPSIVNKIILMIDR